MRDTVVAAGGDWAASIRNGAAWAGDASKVALGAVIGGAAGLAAGWQNRQAARADRVRAYRIEQIRQTETLLSDTLRAMQRALMSRSGLLLLWRASRLEAKMDSLIQAEALLIGDTDAVVALLTAQQQIASKFPVAPRLPSLFKALWIGLRLTFWRPWDGSDVAALETARSECLAALRRQEERALQDEPLVTLDGEAIRNRIDVNAVTAAVARVGA
jgi:hypothetical protein